MTAAYDSTKPNHDLNEFRTPVGLADMVADVVYEK